MKNNIIQFHPGERIKKKASQYLQSPDLILEEKENAVPLLIEAMKYADDEDLQNIIILLAGFADQKTVIPIYELIKDPKKNETIRHIASIQFCIIAPRIPDLQPVINCLLEDINNPDPEIRMYSAIALGWEGNYQAAIPLIDLLYDPDKDVQQAAVHALSNMGDDRIFRLLKDRLEHGSPEQQKSILFNLWQFDSKKKEVSLIYLDYLNHEDPELRFDALTLLDIVADIDSYLAAYCKCLNDSMPGIRRLALERLQEIPDKIPHESYEQIENLISDPDIKVRQEAVKLYKSLKSFRLC
ncbi:HEAT repeat-containing protein [Desulfonema limicola]|uniref:HEAT repeat-containing protein n=1 Tax=Desulfonema limicola TaxID=45656 RepID=A0A975B9T1_9BACT|nr:HEAT repeat domain-containing protein [Desulfonema limicola]QTA81385.1 HEAT repeat-containing protein [Desulfonema limicola]